MLRFISGPLAEFKTKGKRNGIWFFHFGLRLSSPYCGFRIADCGLKSQAEVGVVDREKNGLRSSGYFVVPLTFITSPGLIESSDASSAGTSGFNSG